MDENLHENQQKPSCDCSKERWVKFALILLAVFLGCYLASYYLLDQMRYHFYSPHVRPIHNIDNVIDEQDKLFDDFDAMPVDLNSMMPVNSSIIQTFKKDDAYKIIIDLKPFNGEASNIKTTISAERISIDGEKFSSKKNTQSDYSFSQSFVLPEKINVRAVTKEKVKNKLIITLPLIDND